MRLADQIKKEVVDQLAWDDRVPASDVTVEVRGATVRLGGSVPSYPARLAAATDAWSIPDVSRVENAIRVLPPDSVGPPVADPRIEADARAALEVNPEIDAADVEVEVYDGAIVLRGAVNAFWKKPYAEELVGNVRGVREVDNRLTIVPGRASVDQEIAADILEAIDRSREVDKDDVDVAVSSGRVTLSGVVPTWAARSAAYQAARFASGVRDVRNEIVLAGRD
jgi:osmotically-inducible protein OsmY